MNRIYRRIWSTARRCWVVASELSSPRGKASWSVTASALIALLALPGYGLAEEMDEEALEDMDTLQVHWEDDLAVRAAFGPAIGSANGITGAPIQPFASVQSVRTQAAIVSDYNYKDSILSGDQQLILGSRSWITGSTSVAYGNNIGSHGDHNVAIGFSANVPSGYSTAVGGSTLANGIGTVAVGNSAKANTQNSIAIGSGSQTLNAGGYSRIAIGGDAYAGGSGYTGAIALGGTARADYNGVALGYNANAAASGSVALGINSHATESNSVSVGNSSVKRRVVNVADARLSTTSTDAVTGKQLHATNLNVTAATTTANTARTTANTAKATADAALAKADASSELIRQSSGASSVLLGSQNTGRTLDVHNKNGETRYIYGVRNGTLSASSTDAVAGQQLYATNQGVAVNKAASDALKARLGASAVALGNGALAEAPAYGVSTALGDQARAYNGQSLALGADARAGVDGEGNKAPGVNGAIAVGALSRSGNGAVALGQRSSAVGDRGIAVGNDAVANATHATAMGFQAKAGGNQATALGRGAQADGVFASALGNMANATADSSLALGDRALSQHAASVALGSGSQTSAANQVSVGNASVKRRIVNLADGNVGAGSNEAVTGNQLHATNQAVTTARATADSALAQANTLSGLVGQTAAAGNVRLGAENTGTVLDVRNKSNASRRISGVADGTLSSTSTDAVTGRQLTATNSNVTAAQNAATAAQTTATAARTVADSALGKATTLEGLVGQTSTSGNVRLGAQNTGTVLDVANKTGVKRRIYNIANGVLSAGSTDAVTGQQLFATNALVEGNASQLRGHAQQLLAQNARIGDNRRDLDRLREDVDNFDPDLEGVVKFSDDQSFVDLEGAKLKGVAAGDISSATSTDAVNGGQLFATNHRISMVETGARFLAVDSNDESVEAKAGQQGVAIGESAEAAIDADGATAIGSFARARASGSVALGRGSFVDAMSKNGFALGTGANVYSKDGVGVGAFSMVSAGADGAVALGNFSVAVETNTVSLGNDNLKRRLVNVSRGKDGSDAATVSQLRDSAELLGGGAGIDSNGYVIAPNYRIQGAVHNRVGDALTALDGAVIRSDARIESVEDKYRALFQESTGPRANGVNQLALAGASGMVLTNVANGRVAAGSRDAVNGDQLHAAQEQIDRNRSDLDLLWDERGRKDSVAASINSGPIDFGGARLTGLSAGDISSIESSDAVNGGQLFRSNERISDLEGGAKYLSIGGGGERAAARAGDIAIALGDSAVATPNSEGGVALGSFSMALGKSSVALGRAAYVGDSAEFGFSVGVLSSVLEAGGIALGVASSVAHGATNAVAIGAGAIATEADTVSFGHVSYKRRLVNVANGRSASDAATVGQLRGALAALGGDVDTNGNIIGPHFNVQGGTQSTLDAALQSLDGAVTTNASRVDTVEHQLRSVFQNTPATRSDGLPQLNLAGANGMVLGNVANGLIAAGSRDAVNGGQLHAMQQRLDGRIDGIEQRIDDQPQAQGRMMAKADAPAEPTAPVTPDEQGSKASGTPTPASAGDTPTGRIASADGGKPAAAESPTPQVSTRDLEQMLERANQYTDQATAGIERRLEKMDKRFNRMAAMNSAQSAMAMNTAGLATYNRLGAGVGYSDGESAMAVGYQRVLNDKGSATFSLNGAFTNSGERSMGVGVGIGW